MSQLYNIFILEFPFLPQDDWNGKWFPNPPSNVDGSNGIKHGSQEIKEGRMPMGVISNNCDDGKTNLTVDWDDSPIDYTCFQQRSLYRPKIDVQPIEIVYNIPTEYTALHKCMDTPITYDYSIPTFGTHRPLWPKYGEYVFVPVQRWLHNLEHGALVMLYHPCADTRETQYLKNIVRNCLYRHIITPYASLTEERPLALVTWGHSLEMSKVDIVTVVNFIATNTLRGPEATPRDGQYDYKLLKPAKVVSNQEDSNVCPIRSSK
ncbi:hypothetical protein RI129_005687 [Pyrocoelia pectoralis]|uniref:Tumor protein p53-inducible protein 13 n=1 Tax=Pyrocoelia pectoralis TaxID=417401 RepID=A0AAN7ZHN5_9COLE